MEFLSLFYLIFFLRLRNMLLIPSVFYVVCYWVVILVIILPTIPMISNKLNLTKICSRKLFHYLAVLLFAPVTVLSSSDSAYGGMSNVQFMSLACGGVLCILLWIEYLRYDAKKYISVTLTYTFLLTLCEKKIYGTINNDQNKSNVSVFLYIHI